MNLIQYESDIEATSKKFLEIIRRQGSALYRSGFSREIIIGILTEAVARASVATISATILNTTPDKRDDLRNFYEKAFSAQLRANLGIRECCDIIH